MASYNLFFKKSAEKELRKISAPYLQKNMPRIQTLSKDPRPNASQMLKGESRYYRIRQGDYRIIYEVDDGQETVTIIKIGHRREVYDA